MKFSAIAVALCVLSPVAAFVVPGPQSAKTALASSRENVGPETRTSERSRSAPRRQGRGGDLMSDPNAAYSDFSVQREPRNRRDAFAPTIVQGGSLETWSFPDPRIDRVQVRLETEGRPLNANVELWQGPDNSPQMMGVYVEDASVRPFNAVIATPRGSNAIAIRNTSPLEFPLTAGVEPAQNDDGLWDFDYSPADRMGMRTVQGGAVYTMPFSPGVESVQVMLKTDGRPLNARIELLQGPNNNKQVIELYSEDGLERPFLGIMDTPGTGNVVRIVNTATMEFPLYAIMEPLSVEPGYDPAAYDRSYQERGGGRSIQGRPAW